MEENKDIEGMERLRSDFKELQTRFDSLEIVNKKLLVEVTTQKFEDVRKKQALREVSIFIVGTTLLAYFLLEAKVGWMSFASWLLLVAVTTTVRWKYLKSIFHKPTSTQSVQNAARTMLRYYGKSTWEANSSRKQFPVILATLLFFFITWTEHDGGSLTDRSRWIWALSYSVTMVIPFYLWGKKSRKQQKEYNEKDIRVLHSLCEIIRDLDEEDSSRNSNTK